MMSLQKMDFIFTYLIIGFLTAIVAGILGLDVVTAFGVGILWPLFAVKYIALGLWLVLYSGLTLLIGV